MNDSLHSVKEIARILSVSPELVREEIKSGRMKAFIYGRGDKARQTEINRFIEDLYRKQNGG